MTQQKFINREKEMKFMNEAYNSKKPEFVVLYGRRRIGKTELIIKFLEKNRNGVYFLATTEGDKQNMNVFKKKISEIIKDESLLNIEVGDWFSLFNLLSKNMNFMKVLKEKFVIAVDEFPFLMLNNPSIPSVFQKIWETILKNKNIMLIVSGSSVSVMEENVIGYKSPLYGRRTRQWELQPLSFVEARKFLPRYDIEGLIQAWFVVGGVPEYLLKFDTEIPFWQNAEQNIITKGCYLYREAEVLLKEEFREPKNYALILKAISFGKTTLGEICNFTGLDKSMVSKYLEVLKNIGIIVEEIPVTASPKFKKRLHFLADPYFNFWFRYVLPNKIDLEAHRDKEVLSAIKKDFPQYAGFMFERLIERLIREKIFLNHIIFTKIGRWWHKGREIDIVALNEKTKEILFCECKWRSNVDAKSVLEGLKEKSRYVQWHAGKRKEHYAIFAKSFREKTSERNVSCFDLKDMEKSLR